MTNLTAPADLQVRHGHKTVSAVVHGTGRKVCLFSDPLPSKHGKWNYGFFTDDNSEINNNGLIVEITEFDSHKVDPDSYVYTAQLVAHFDS